MKNTNRILIVVGNPALTPHGERVGFWAAELTHPYFEFNSAGYEVTIASPEGGKVEFDVYSDPRHPSGHSARDLISLGFIHAPVLMELLENTPSAGSLSADDYDAILIAGGSSPMFTFAQAENLHDLFLSFWRAGKPSAALCHGTALLLFLKNEADGKPFVSGKTITGSSNEKEVLIEQKVGEGFFPFRIEDEAKKRGANFIAHHALHPFAVRDGNLITGQQEYSGALTARLVLAALGH
ncbi:MAG TPA: type 1 glutamine amidotransferase domain-containing protein [Pyrinomonadaceae bacterium]|nr:type 1 glutamine amidotransferase domain-containing protein [Pyrinomonadaceae bacterium]